MTADEEGWNRSLDLTEILTAKNAKDAKAEEAERDRPIQPEPHWR